MKLSLSEKLSKYCVEDADSGCLVWTRSTRGGGYGKVWDGTTLVATHRAAYELAYGAIPDGLLVMHSCDNPPCCNPEHLFLGTNQDNSDDKVAKGRQPKGETHGLYGRVGNKSHNTGLVRTKVSCNAVFSPQVVSDIRAEYVPRKVSLRFLAKKYGVCHATIRMLVAGLQYKL